jgi:hypothetical protein
MILWLFSIGGVIAVVLSAGKSLSHLEALLFIGIAIIGVSILVWRE